MARRLYLRQFLQALIEQSDGSGNDNGSDGDDDVADIEDNGGGGGGGDSADQAEEEEEEGGVIDADALLRALLFRHGHPMRSHLRRGNTEEEETEYRRAIEERKSRLQQHDFARVIRADVGMLQRDVHRGGSDDKTFIHDSNSNYNYNNVFGLLHARERNDPFSNTRPRVANIARRYIPNTCRSVLGGHRHQVFCGQFSQDGSVFLSASQDQTIRLYHTDNIEYSIAQRKRATPFKLIQARDVGWSVVDTHFSPDQTSIIYSSWSPYVHLCTIDMDERSRHEPLDLSPPSMRFCPFSIRFSPDSREILAGANDCALYIFDIEYKRRILRIDDAHADDINTVTFADQSPHIFFSGSDDTLIKVWDRRSFSASNSSPVGVMAGHASGLTCVSSKGDGIYFITNGKDQCMKLWDVRTMKNQGEGVPRISSESDHWDYRYDHPVQRRIHPQDMSLMTYTGHRVLQTLVRCYFSPKETTGQNFVYTGSQDGSICIYDVLTGEMVQKLRGHTAIVRDVSWHPHKPLLLSSSWDTSVRCWQWSPVAGSWVDQVSPMRVDPDDNDDDGAYDEEDDDNESEYEETGLRGIRFGMFIGSDDGEYEYIVEADSDEEDSVYEM